jgi:hypothetical protein
VFLTESRVAADVGSFPVSLKPKPTASSWAKPVPCAVNLPDLQGLARSVGSTRPFSLSDFPIYGRIQISYCEVENIHCGTLISLQVVLAEFRIMTTREMLHTTF